MTDKYLDIINHAPVRPRGRQPQPLTSRAAQFAPFAALK